MIKNIDGIRLIHNGWNKSVIGYRHLANQRQIKVIDPTGCRLQFVKLHFFAPGLDKSQNAL